MGAPYIRVDKILYPVELLGLQVFKQLGQVVVELSSIPQTSENSLGN